MRNINSIIILAFLFILTSCEGLKVIQVTNYTDENVHIIMKPGFGYFEDATFTNFPKDKISDSTTFKIQPDSSIYLHSNFGFITFNTKIKEYELQADYLRIETKFDTIVAKDKKEIRKLIYGRRQGSIKVKGSNWVEVSIGKKKK